MDKNNENNYSMENEVKDLFNYAENDLRKVMADLFKESGPFTGRFSPKTAAYIAEAFNVYVKLKETLYGMAKDYDYRQKELERRLYIIEAKVDDYNHATNRKLDTIADGIREIQKKSGKPKKDED